MKKKKLWQTENHVKGRKQKFYFDNEFDAAKKLNKLCEKIGIPPQNPEICEIQNQQKTSQYKGFYWHKKTGKWYVSIYLKGQMRRYSRSFKDELDAAKRVNEFCDELGIPPKNPDISAITNEQYQKKEKISQNKGYYWQANSAKWSVQIYQKGQAPRYGGLFSDELDAAKRVNQLCEEMKISTRNPEISAIPNQQYQKKEKTSQYIGVTWHEKRAKWQVQVFLNEKKQTYGGLFKDELDAARRVNQLCDEMGTPPKNPGISVIQNQQYQETSIVKTRTKREKTSQYKGVAYTKSGKWKVNVRKKHGGYFKDELDAAKSVNQICEELGISPLNSGISALQNQQYQKKEKTSQFKGVSWDKKIRKWRVAIYPKGQKPKYGGSFKNEVDAANSMNQICEELGIPSQNPNVIEIPTHQSPNDDDQTITNPVINSEILKTDNGNARTKKRKREKELKRDNKLPVDKFYFYDHLLK